MARKREIVAEAKRKARRVVNPMSLPLQTDAYLAYCVERNLTPKTINSYAYHLGYLK